MQLNDFTGGLNLRLALHLIGQNEGVIYSNIDTIKGSLVPLKQDTKTSISMSRYIVNFKDTWISSDIETTYVEFQEKLYYTTGSGIPQKTSDGVTFQNLGIVKPRVKPITTSNTIDEPTDILKELETTTLGTFDSGIYRFKYSYYSSTFNLETSLSSTLSITLSDLEVDEDRLAIKLSIPASTDTNISNIRLYLLAPNGSEYKLVTTFSNIATEYELLDNSVTTNVYTNANIFNGTYQYCYTYYNSTDGTESQPSTYSNELKTISNSISVTVTASSDSQVDKIRLYRIGGNLTTMSLVTTLSNTTQTYLDTLADDEIDSRVLDSYNNKQAPSNLVNLTEANAMFFGTVSDKLWFSEIAYVNYWSEFNYIDFDSPITGIGNTQNGLLVFTKYKTYIVTGNSPSTLSKYLLDGSQGCLSHKSIAFVKGTLIWVSSDGICWSSGGTVEVLSRAKLGNLTITNIKDSIVWDDVYYLSYSNSTLVVDFRFGVIFSNLDISPDSFYNYKDQVYYSNNSELYTLFTSTEDRSIDFTTGLLSDGSISTLKNYKNVYLNTTGTLTFKTYINNELVSTKLLNGGVEEVKFPQDKRLGYNIRFSFSGVGSVLEIAYTMEGRQNGR